MPRAKKSEKPLLEVKYLELCEERHVGEDAVTAELAKVLLGWQEVVGDEAPQLVDGYGKRITCVNNIHNRPLYLSDVATYQQEHLRRRWHYNGEPIIIGKYGQVLNGQHTLISLILAVQEWEQKKEDFPQWEHEPTMDKLIVYGVEEDDAVVNTLDTGKRRSLTDVLYRSVYFAGLKKGDRKGCARICDYAIRFLWHRTGASLDAFAPRRTHAESLDFLGRHPRLLECIRHIYEEESTSKKISKYVSTGSAAGLMYLMATSTSDPKQYVAKNRHESGLSFFNWDKAQNFWVLLAGNSKELLAIRDAYAKIREYTEPCNAERWALLINAWLCTVNGEAITDTMLELEYQTNEDGEKALLDMPTCGGIDLGNPKEADEEAIPTIDPSKEEIATRAAEVKAEGRRKGKAPPLPKLKPSKAGEVWAAGDIAWICEPGEEAYLGKLLEDSGPGIKTVMVTAADGAEWETKIKWLKLEKVVTSNHPTPSPKSTSGWRGGQIAWVHEENDEPWQGRVVEVNAEAKVARLKIQNGFSGAGNVKVIPLMSLRTQQPAA